MRSTFAKKALIIISTLAFSFQISGQTIKKGKVERILVYGKSLGGNLAGDSPNRNVSVYLPASYALSPNKRYPVVYFLHGFTDTDAQWYGLQQHWISLPAILDTAYSKGNLKECIFVTPNGFTNFFGSWYSNSIVTGNWEQFIAKELVSQIDKKYRTIPQSGARGLAGHSMGGYGSLRIGEKYPDVFSSIYLLSPAIFIPGTTPTIKPEEAEKLKSFDDLQKADFLTKAVYSLAAAWSPNPNNPPFYLDLPGKEEAGQVPVATKWAANLPLASLDQNINSLKLLRGIGFDAGDKDEEFADAVVLFDKELNKYKVKHYFEVYSGDHLNRVGERIKTKVLPFFSELLTETPKRKAK